MNKRKRMLSALLSLAVAVPVICAGFVPSAMAEEAEAGTNDLAITENLGFELNLDPDGVLQGQFSGQSITVFCCTGEFSEPLQESIDLFEQLSGATVNLSIYSWDELGSKIALALAGDEEMDAVCFVSAYMNTYAQLGQLVDLTEASETYASTSFEWDGFASALLDRTSIDGECYAVPYQVCETMDFYRKDLLEDPDIQAAYLEATGEELKAPETKEELQTIAEFFTKSFNSDSPTTYGYIAQGTTNAALWTWMSKLGAFGGTMFGDDFECQFNTEAGAAAMNYSKDMLQYGPSNWNENGFDEVNTLMNGGEAFICENWSSAYPSISAGDMSGKIGCVPTTDSSMTVSGWSLGINSLSENQELAWRFIEFCTSPDGQMTSVDNGITPTRTANIERLIGAGEDAEYYNALIKCFGCENTCFGDVSLPYLGATGTTIIDTYTQQMYKGEISAEDALDQMQAGIEEALSSIQ